MIKQRKTVREVVLPRRLPHAALARATGGDSPPEEGYVKKVDGGGITAD